MSFMYVRADQGLNGFNIAVFVQQMTESLMGLEGQNFQLSL